MQKLRVLVACEYSGTVRDAFAALGHDATSCDLLPTDSPGKHHQGDVRELLRQRWDLMVAHPPCTYLTRAGLRWLYHPDDKHLPTSERRRHPNYPNRLVDQEAALEFVRFLMDADIPRIAIENPVSIISSRIRKPDQVIQPWMFGHGEVKATALWLKGLPKLTPTNAVEGREQRIHRLAPGPLRWKERSKTFPGIAAAMASQWGA
jgi:site-specific DNA-cytosine methylase